MPEAVVHPRILSHCSRGPIRSSFFASVPTKTIPSDYGELLFSSPRAPGVAPSSVIITCRAVLLSSTYSGRFLMQEAVTARKCRDYLCFRMEYAFHKSVNE